MDDTSSASPRQNWLLKLFSHPWVGVMGTLASIIGIPLAVFLTQLTISYPRICYLANNVRTTIVTEQKSSELHVSYGATEISGPVTAVQIVFWNAGKQPVRSSDILSPLEFVLQGKVQIFEATFQNPGRQVTRLQLDDSKKKEGILSVKWDILEQGDGGILQIVYNGKPDVAVVGSLQVVGQAQAEDLWTRRDSIRKNRGIFFPLLTLALVPLVGYGAFFNLKAFKLRSFDSWFVTLLSLASAVAVLFAFRGFMEYYLTPALPPSLEQQWYGSRA